MGLFFANRTWRAPLQLIDCWLPAPAARRTVGSNPVRNTSPLLQTFRRAGWLRPSEHTTPLPPVSNRSSCPQAPAAWRANGHPTATPRRPLARLQGDGRLWIAGRIEDVCAELERLEALERQH